MIPEYLWVAYSDDEIGLPIAVADSAGMLAKKVGMSQNAILSAMSHAKKRGTNCKYARFSREELEAIDDDDQ